jgi:hypothetical protein
MDEAVRLNVVPRLSNPILRVGVEDNCSWAGLTENHEDCEGSVMLPICRSVILSPIVAEPLSKPCTY